jgi:hypothetical protein
VDRFVDIFSAGPVKYQRDTGRIEMRLEPRRAFGG